jgi:superfamily I DNA/RNA helicase
VLDLNDPSTRVHNGYLKRWALTNPDLSAEFDLVLLDEAQDLDPCTGGVVFAQPMPVVYVGDSHQHIYGRGAKTLNPKP